MAERPLTKFIELVHFDQKLQAMHTEIDNLKKHIHQVQETKSELSQQVEEAKHASHAARKQVDSGELQAKELEQELQEKKRRLDQVQTSKEFQSLTAEMGKLKQAQQDLEPGLMAAWETLESATKIYQDRQKQITSQLQELDAQEQTSSQKIIELEQTIKTHEHDRDNLINQIPEQWRDPYEMMRSRVKDPVVPVDRQICSACSYRIIDNDFQSLRLGRLLQCRGCYRFLYLPSAE